MKKFLKKINEGGGAGVKFHFSDSAGNYNVTTDLESEGLRIKVNNLLITSYGDSAHANDGGYIDFDIDEVLKAAIENYNEYDKPDEAPELQASDVVSIKEINPEYFPDLTYSWGWVRQDLPEGTVLTWGNNQTNGYLADVEVILELAQGETLTVRTVSVDAKYHVSQDVIYAYQDLDSYEEDEYQEGLNIKEEKMNQTDKNKPFVKKDKDENGRTVYSVHANKTGGAVKYCKTKKEADEYIDKKWGKKKVNEELRLFADMSDYSPWSGAVSTYEIIRDANKLDELESTLEEYFPEGLSLTELNDVLWHESDWILGLLGLPNDEEDDEYGESLKNTIRKSESLLKEDNSIQPGEIYGEAVKLLPPEDIDYHETDLYLRKTPESTALVNRLTNKSLLTIFRDNIEGDIWYELPFCYPNKRILKSNESLKGAIESSKKLLEDNSYISIDTPYYKGGVDTKTGKIIASRLSPKYKRRLYTIELSLSDEPKDKVEKEVIDAAKRAIESKNSKNEELNYKEINKKIEEYRKANNLPYDFQIKKFDRDSEEFKKLHDVAVKVSDNTNISVRVEDTWFDYGQKWMWTTLIAVDGSKFDDPVLNKWQAINPSQQAAILAGYGDEVANDLISKYKKEYGNSLRNKKMESVDIKTMVKKSERLINEISDELADKTLKKRYKNLSDARGNFMKRAFDFDSEERQQLQNKAALSHNKALKSQELYKKRRFKKEFGNIDNFLDYIGDENNFKKVNARLEKENSLGRIDFETKLGKK